MQAARGASLSSQGDAEQTTPSTSGHRILRYRLLFAGVALAAYALDQITKALAAAHLTPGEPKDLVGSLLRLDLTRNAGAAFSTGTSHTEIFTALAIVAVVVVLWFAAKTRSVLWAAALGLLLAGIIGNLTDRIFREPQGMRGHVVDFLELPHWPIFNVADMCINVAAVLIVIQVYRGVRVGGDHSRPAPDGADA